MEKFKCRCVKEINYFNFFPGHVYEGIISTYETGVTILGPNKEQETYLAQGLFEKYFEMV
jgi:hypothetical protein